MKYFTTKTWKELFTAREDSCILFTNPKCFWVICQYSRALKNKNKFVQKSIKCMATVKNIGFKTVKLLN